MSRPPVPPPVPKDDDSTREAYTRRLRRKTPDPTEDAVTHKLRRARRDTGRYPERDRFLPALADCIAAELKAVPGEAVRPVSAARSGCATAPSLMSSASANARTVVSS